MNSKGETIIEALAAVLISSLATMILYAGVVGSKNLFDRGDGIYRTYTQRLEGLDTFLTENTDYTRDDYLTVVFENETVIREEVEVQIYEDLFAFRKKT